MADIDMKFANPSNLDFPLDRYGITSELRTAFIKCVDRVRGDKEKLETLNNVLAVLIKHKNARFVDFNESTGSVSNFDRTARKRELAYVGGSGRPKISIAVDNTEDE